MIHIGREIAQKSEDQALDVSFNFYSVSISISLLRFRYDRFNEDCTEK